MQKKDVILLWTAILGVFVLMIWNILLQQQIDQREDNNPWVCTTLADYYKATDPRATSLLECV